MDEGKFKEHVTEYVELCDTLKPVATKMKLMRKRMVELEEGIVTYMKANTLQQCRLQDHSCLKFCTSNRKINVSKKQLLNIVDKVLNNDPSKSKIQKELDVLQQETITKDYLKRQS